MGVGASQSVAAAAKASSDATSQMTAATLFPKPPKKLASLTGRALGDWDMIKDGDRVLLGLSGGKDSLCLLHLLLSFQKRAPIKFELAAATVDPGTEAFDPSPLIPYMESLGVKYHYIKTDIFENAKTKIKGDSYCAFCARMKRGALYSCAKEHGYTTLALAQHLDDFAESFFMSFETNGSLRTMKANYVASDHGVRVIRPLAYVRESMTKEFSYAAKLPVINENCPACFEVPQERKRVKKLLAREEAALPGLFGSLRKALVPLMSQDAQDSLGALGREVENRGKSVGGGRKQRAAAGARSASGSAASGS